MLKRLNKAANLNFGITALQATVGSYIKDLSSQISLTEKRMHEIISKLSGHVPSKLAMQDYKKNLTVHHPELTSHINLDISHLQNINKERVNFQPLLAVFSLFLAILGLSTEKYIFTGPLIYNIGLRILAMTFLNATSQDINHLKELRVQVNMHIYDHSRLKQLTAQQTQLQSEKVKTNTKHIKSI